MIIPNYDMTATTFFSVIGRNKPIKRDYDLLMSMLARAYTDGYMNAQYYIREAIGVPHEAQG